MQLNAENNTEISQEDEIKQINPESIESTDNEIEIISDDEILIEDESKDFDDEEDNQKEEDSRFTEGELITMIRVRFPGNAKSFPFIVGKKKFSYGQKVVAMSDRGMTVGYINSFPYQVPFNKQMLPIRSIAKIATQEDIKAQIEFRDSEKKAEVICLNLIEKYNLDMVLTHVEFTQFGKKAVFYFNAPSRVDFRDLVKDLVNDLKMRIELRQISVRDRAAAIGAIGACGLQTCCSSFLKNYGNVSIKMAKNQNLALMASKLNGVCGQIKCCIKFEDDVYTDKRKLLPKEGSFIQTKGGDKGKVLKLHLLLEQFEMLTDKGAKRCYSAGEYHHKNAELPSDYKFPETFDHIVNETSTVIGLQDYLEAKKQADSNTLQTIEVPLNQNEKEAILNNKDIEPIDSIDEIIDDLGTNKQSRPQHQHNKNPRNNHSKNNHGNKPRNNDHSNKAHNNLNKPSQNESGESSNDRKVNEGPNRPNKPHFNKNKSHNHKENRPNHKSVENKEGGQKPHNPNQQNEQGPRKSFDKKPNHTSHAQNQQQQHDKQAVNPDGAPKNKNFKHKFKNKNRNHSGNPNQKPESAPQAQNNKPSKE